MKIIYKILKTIGSPLVFYFRWCLESSILIAKNPTLKIGHFAKIKNVNLGKYNHVAKNSFLSNSEIGDFSYISQNSSINNAKIGKFTCIGPGVSIGLAEHPTNSFVSVHPVFFSTAKQVGITFVDKNYFDEFPTKCIIGNDVWIGAGVTVTKSIKIGDGAIIAAGSILTKNVEPYSVVGGIPAHLIKKRFTSSEIDYLLKTKWWNKPISYLNNNAKAFHSIKTFQESIFFDENKS
jgi:acetyltransferase-like isoleucine patch superfamily enzyme